jgi:hypothetical protein
MEIITTPNPQKPTTKPTPTILFIATVLAVGVAPLVHAQSNTSTNADTSNSVMNTMAPSAGANSFTETQAQSRIRKAGYSNISGLTKGEDGIWRGTATKNGTTRNVMLDFKGNVTAQ